MSHETLPHLDMSDPKWKNYFIPVMSKAILALSTFISGHLFDKLLQSGLISSDQYERLTKLDRDSTCIKSDVARELFMMLKRRPCPSFDNFCSVMRDVDTENELLCYMTPQPLRFARIRKPGQKVFDKTGSGEDKIPISGFQASPHKDGHVVARAINEYLYLFIALVAAIHIATTFSTYACSLSSSPIFAMLWTNKVPTTLVFKPYQTFLSFRHVAMNHCNRELDESEQEKWYYLDEMKLHTKWVSGTCGIEFM